MNEIRLQDLIYQVKRELLAPNPAERAKDPYPLFVIDRIDLEVFVNISHVDSNGVKLTILDLIEVGRNNLLEHKSGHVIRISLSPLLSREEILIEARRDPKVEQAIKDRHHALLKGDQGELKGEPE